MTHIDTAVAEGPKAGMRQYLAKLATYAPGTKQAAILSEYLALGKGLNKSDAEKAIFSAYCANFTDAISAGQAQGSTDENEGELLAFLTGQPITKAQAIAHVTEDDTVGVVVEQQGGTQGVIAKVAQAARRGRNTRKDGVPKVGDTFIYHGANGDSTHKVVGEGLTKKHKKPGLTCRNENGKDRVWNLNTLAIYAEQNKLSIV